VKRSRVLVVLHPSLMPPDSLEGLEPKAIEEWRTDLCRNQQSHFLYAQNQENYSQVGIW
jgi:hypothetical protein